MVPFPYGCSYRETLHLAIDSDVRPKSAQGVPNARLQCHTRSTLLPDILLKGKVITTESGSAPDFMHRRLYIDNDLIAGVEFDR